MPEKKLVCDFCYATLEKFSDVYCPECGYPARGSKDGQEKFIAANETTKKKIDEADTALSQARFAMLWPSLTAIIVTLALGHPTQHYVESGITLAFYLLFVAMYFVAALKPFPILILCFTILLGGILFSFLRGSISKGILLVPGIIALIYLNGIYSVWRAEKALEKIR